MAVEGHRLERHLREMNGRPRCETAGRCCAAEEPCHSKLCYALLSFFSQSEARCSSLSHALAKIGTQRLDPRSLVEVGHWHHDPSGGHLGGAYSNETDEGTEPKMLGVLVVAQATPMLSQHQMRWGTDHTWRTLRMPPRLAGLNDLGARWWEAASSREAVVAWDIIRGKAGGEEVEERHDNPQGPETKQQPQAPPQASVPHHLAFFFQV